MPIQAPQWTDYLSCPVCCGEFGPPPRSPISIGCGHTLCRHCINHLHRKQCPFDHTAIPEDPEELVVNTALLQLTGCPLPVQPYLPPSIQALSEADRESYVTVVKCVEHLAGYLKCNGNNNNNVTGSRLSRPMQRKLVMLLQCAFTDEEGRGKAARSARSLGERTVTELILQHQNPQQLSANLWAAVRARGCQFLGPAMQEEVLKLVLLALENGSSLSRKVLVMFVVQRLEPHFPQASKTSIGHVVQLLYRASCFMVSKRERESSLMQLKEEFRTYEALRREHDAQIVQIANEAGLKIAPDQWSALLYGDTAHKSLTQSIIDKLQTPASFAQSVQELSIALQRTGDPSQINLLKPHLDRLAVVNPLPDSSSPSWQELSEVMTSLKEVIDGFVRHLQQQALGRDANHNQKLLTDRYLDSSSNRVSPQMATTPTHSKYKVYRDAAARAFCPRGSTCTYAHSEEELDRYREYVALNGNCTFVPINPALPGPGIPLPPGYAHYTVPPPQPLIDHHNNFNVPPPPLVNMAPEMGQNTITSIVHPAGGYSIHHASIIPAQHGTMAHEIMIPPGTNLCYTQYNLVPEVHRAPNVQFRPELCPQNNLHTSAVIPPEMIDFRVPPPPLPAVQIDSRAADAVRAPNPNMTFNFAEMRRSLPPAPHAEQELEAGLKALERRIDSEFESAD